MKTIPHVVLERHLRMFHPDRIQSIHQQSVSQKPRRRKQTVKRSTKGKGKGTRKGKGKKRVKAGIKKTIKGRVTKKSRQSAARRQRNNIRDIFSS